jgi:competence ComEA-like helix-hairpin-helix protein
VNASRSDFALALIVCALAAVGLARSDPAAPRAASLPLRAAAREPPRAVALSQLREGQTLELNRATASDLALLPGIGPKLAERIVDERTRRGGFGTVAQLRAVHGVGPATLQRVERFLRVTPTSRAPATP